MLHALLEYEKISGDNFDHATLLQPTTPLRSSKDMDKSIQMITEEKERNSLISVYDGRCVHLRIMYTEKE